MVSGGEDSRVPMEDTCTGYLYFINAQVGDVAPSAPCSAIQQYHTLKSSNPGLMAVFMAVFMGKLTSKRTTPCKQVACDVYSWIFHGSRGCTWLHMVEADILDLPGKEFGILPLCETSTCF